MFQIIDNVFNNYGPVDITAGKFNHCSSVCPLSTGVLLAWYAGDGECQDNQSVYLMIVQKGRKSNFVRIGDKTGNPVVLPIDKNNAMLLYSRFEETKEDGSSFPIRRLVDRWKYCSLWLQKVSYSGGIKLVNDPICIVNAEQHLLGRCNPIYYEGNMLIPLYDEVKAEGVIASYDGEFKLLGRIGNNMIQPTIWTYGSAIYSVSRNFRSTNRFARSSISLDGGRTWSDPMASRFPNTNSSVHAMNINNNTYIIWNNTTTVRRKNLTLGTVVYNSGGLGYKIIDGISVDGSYPSMCQTYGGKLVFTYTKNGVIQYNEWGTRKLSGRTRDNHR